MKRSNTDLIVGGVIFISLFILIAGVLWLKEISISRKLVQYTILFPNVGELVPGNPVKANGVKCGQVSKIYMHSSNKVAVEIKLDKTIRFTDSSIVAIKNIGLMGERMVGIQLSNKGTPYPPDTKETVNLIMGEFDSGIAEAMGMLGKVLGDVEVLLDTVSTVIRETVGNDEFILFFNTIVKRLDTIVLLVDNLVATNTKEIDLAIDNVVEITENAKTLINNNSGNINSIMDDGTKLTGAALGIANRLDTITLSIQSIITDVESGKGSVGVLLQDETIVKDLKETMKNLDALVKEVQEDALKLRIKVFGNKKYFKDNENDE